MRWFGRSHIFETLQALALTFAITVELLSAAPARAQDAGDSPGAYEIGVQAGPFLPSRISRVREIVQCWGPRFTVPTRKGIFELGGFYGRGSGIVYSSVTLDYRADVANPYLPVHVLLGFHGDYYAPPGQEFKFGGGWHFGGGVTQEITRSLLFRTDFTYRFSPGNSLYIGLGLVYRFADGGAS